MIKDVETGILRVIFDGYKDYSVSQIANILLLIEKKYQNNIENIFKINNSKLKIYAINPEEKSFDLIPYEIYPNMRTKNLAEVIICTLYSFYNSSIETDLYEVTGNVFVNSYDIYKYMEKDQFIILKAFIDNKMIQVKIQSDTKTFMDNFDFNPQIPVYKTLEDVINSYKTNKDQLFINANLEHLDLQNIDLSKANFINAELYKANLNSTKLEAANFYNADVSSSSLIGADLTKANLEGSDFSNSDLSNSTLESCILNYSDMSSTNLTNAKLHNISILGTDFSAANLTGCKITGKINYNKDTDFSNNTNWWDAKIDNPTFLEWLQQNFPQKTNG